MEGTHKESATVSLRGLWMESFVNHTWLFSCTNTTIIDLSGNRLTTIKVALCPWARFTNLRALYLHSNSFSEVSEVVPLQGVRTLIHLTLYDNAGLTGYRSDVVTTLPTLLSLDDYLVSDVERLSAENYPKHCPRRFYPLSTHFRIPLTIEAHPMQLLSHVIMQCRRVNPSMLIQRVYRRYRFRQRAKAARLRKAIRHVRLAPLLLIQSLIRRFLSTRRFCYEYVVREAVQTIYVTTEWAKEKILRDAIAVKRARVAGQAPNVTQCVTEIKVLRDHTRIPCFRETRSKPVGRVTVSSTVLLISSNPLRNKKHPAARGPTSQKLFRNQISHRALQHLVSPEHWKKLSIHLKRRKRTEALWQDPKASGGVLWEITVYDRHALSYLIHCYGQKPGFLYLKTDVIRMAHAVTLQRWWRGCAARMRVRRDHFLPNTNISLYAATYFATRIQCTWRRCTAKLRADFLRLLKIVINTARTSCLALSFDCLRQLKQSNGAIGSPPLFMKEQRAWQAGLTLAKDAAHEASLVMHHDTARKSLPFWLQCVCLWGSGDLLRSALDITDMGVRKEVHPFCRGSLRYGHVLYAYRSRPESVMRAVSLFMLTFDVFKCHRICFEPPSVIRKVDAATILQRWWAVSARTESHRDRAIIKLQFLYFIEP